ncbi:ribulosamine/erythrulosamine 3-kinase potentially involved in protein deglycation [Pseudanabaena sp. lw0831]|uniref:fructosamine kinase family protein n=1 Tax=Pseudanabaena sp. lw0831 TaxID=1357935 RepID=UPI00191557C7|nr:fructosamine kinase family protein [Pseudanabaena sp. lw0831]GBO52439.1 ribulosamine/erythrulosamine 3-kinase potentially involved in protein deglycation [Pseudanabaena sp. lw0831]
MWDEIAIAISQATGERFTCDLRQAQSGGCINQTTRISDSQRQFFVKTNIASSLDMFVAEAIALKQMYTTHTIRVPQPICWGIANDAAYLVMENLELGGRQDWEAMGRNLAAIHRVNSDRGFGWDQNNAIGSTPQINNWTNSWLDFWIEYRLGFQFRLARRKGWQSNIPEEKIYKSLSRFFDNYQPQPSMVHGDLWGGNAAFVDGEPVIFDPALYFGDREVDLAMTELFGGFPSQFYRAYQDAYPLDSGYQQRKTLYNLYHILNHFHLFGGGYGSQANRMIETICK